MNWLSYFVLSSDLKLGLHSSPLLVPHSYMGSNRYKLSIYYLLPEYMC
jgi:hypothetical protein